MPVVIDDLEAGNLNDYDLSDDGFGNVGVTDTVAYSGTYSVYSDGEGFGTRRLLASSGTFSDEPDNGNTTFSLRWRAAGNRTPAMMFGVQSDTSSYGIRCNTNDGALQILTFASDGTSTAIANGGDLSIPTGVWHRYECTWDGSDLEARVYLGDGSSSDSTVSASDSTHSSGGVGFWFSRTGESYADYYVNESVSASPPTAPSNLQLTEQ